MRAGPAGAKESWGFAWAAPWLFTPRSIARWVRPSRSTAVASSAGRFGYPAQLERATGLRTPWLGLYGDLDRNIPALEVEALREVAAGARVPTEVVHYADADHGFNCNDRPSVYNPGVAADAWARTLAWFDAYLARR